MKLQFQNKLSKNWRIDEDGYLRITICCLKEGVFEYGADEVPGITGLPNLQGKPIIREYIPCEEMERDEAIKSLEGKDIIVGDHDWQTPVNYETAKIAGAVAGTPYCENGRLLCEAIIKCPETIENITSDRTPERERYVEVSAGYDGNLVAEGGEFDGAEYDAKQTDFRFNHILLLPAGHGRCGKDVRILNTKNHGGKHMGATTLKVRVGNSERSYRFSNEEDAVMAEGMLEEERKFNAEEVAKSLEEKEKLSAQVTDLQAQLAQHDENLKKAKLDLEHAIGIENQEAVAGELVEQAADEEAIVADEAESGWTEKEAGGEEGILNSIRKAEDGKKFTLPERRQNMVRVIMKNRGVEIPDTWTPEAYDAAFETLAITAHINNSKRDTSVKTTERVLNGKPTEGSVNPAQDNRARMLNAMKLRKGGNK